MMLTLEQIGSKNITLGICGLGYVGYPLALAFAEVGVQVIGFDIDRSKIEKILNGESYIQHINHGRLQHILEHYAFTATQDFTRIRECDVIILCVPTPLNHHHEPDLSYIENTCKTIAPYLKEGSLVSLESTSWPGTTEEIAKPLLEEGSKMVCGEGFDLCFSPEREDPGNKEFNTRTIPKLVGGVNDRSLALGCAVYSLTIEHVVPVRSTQIAEAAKLFENIFRSVNIALVNELKMILDKMNIDVWEVIQASATKPFGFMPFWPGPGLGGHCIPIDPFYLSWKARQHGITTRFIELAGEINRSMPSYVIQKVQDCLNLYKKSLNGSHILLLGLAYKPDIDDMRESPSLELMRLLEQQGASVDYHDPYLPSIGMTREYKDFFDRKSVAISKNYDCFLLATKHSIFNADEILSFGIPVVDTRNLLPKCNLVIKS